MTEQKEITEQTENFIDFSSDFANSCCSVIALLIISAKFFVDIFL